jgi:hypothetical protein
VDHVGTEAGEIVDHVAHPRKRPLDVGVEKEGNAGRPVHLGTLALARRKTVGRRVHPHLVSARLERVRETQQGHPDPAHHRPVDFGEEGYAHAL